MTLDVLTQHGALPAAEIAGHVKAAGREIGSRTISFTLQAMKSRSGAANGSWRSRVPWRLAVDGMENRPDLLGGFATRARNSIGAPLHERQAQQFDNKKREDDTQG
jgi:hypothetical protein